MNSKISLLKLTLSAMFSVISLTLFWVESMIPPLVPIPGIKIGLAYIPILFAAFVGGKWRISNAALILIVRLILSAITFSSPSSLLFSVCGGISAMAAMTIIKAAIKQPYGVVFAGIFGAIMHNIGQLSAASLIYTSNVWAYLPYLMISAVLSGLFTGFLVYYIIRKPSKAINKIKYIE